MASTPFEPVVVEHGETVWRVCRAVLGRHTDADDAWSETFLAALRAWPALPDDANVQAWLVTIAHRKCLDQVRDRQRRPAPTTRLADTPTRHGVPDSEAMTLWQAVGALPDKQRQAVAYHYLGGLPYQQVADLLGGTAAAARRAAADGIRRLREPSTGLTCFAPDTTTPPLTQGSRP